MNIRIHIADDHGVFRAGLRALIENEEDLTIIGESGNSAQTLKMAQEAQPDVLLLDIHMPGIPTAQVVQTLTEETPSVAVLILTMSDEEYYLKEFLKAGAKGFMVKTSNGSDVVQAIRSVHQGKQFIDASMSQYLVSNYLGHDPKGHGADQPLTKRELEVCGKLALGYTNEEVAESFRISKRTVESHRAAIMTKLGLKSRAEIVRYAISQGLLNP